MEPNAAAYRRQSIRLPGYDYSELNTYCITICCDQRRCLFGDIKNGKIKLNEIGEVVAQLWRDIPLHFSHAELDLFVVMPNHIHGLINIVDFSAGSMCCRGTACRAPTMERFSLPTIGTIPTIIRSFKSAVTKRVHEMQAGFLSVWQRNYYERIVRNEKELNALRDYVVLNPMKWELDKENPNARKCGQVASRVRFLYDVSMLNWTDPLSFIHGLTAQQRRVLKPLEVETVGELLMIMPRRYDDYSHLATLAQTQAGVPVTVKVTVKEIKRLPSFRQRFALIRALVSDASGSISVTWFNQPWLLKQLKPGDEIFLSGTITRRPRFGRGFTSPLWEPVNEETLAAGNIAPVYPLTGSLSQKTLRRVMKAAVDDMAPPDDPLPEDVRVRAHVPALSDALRFVHRPTTLEQAEEGRRRIAFGELLIYQLALAMAREEANVAGAQTIKFDEAFAKAFAASLPFQLTDDQKKAVWAAVKDLEAARPMRRLLQGDVGSGKTVVAAMLAALTFRAGSSAALMVPTDLLAKQHMATLRRFLAPHHIPVLLVTSSARTLAEGGEERALTPEEARERMRQGRIVAVGTHALLERGAAPPDLALAIVDEQHRFGVSQREALTVSARQDGKVPHLLSMSATPIPRSLALTLLGDLDVSLIRVKPSGRKPVATSVALGEDGREHVYQAIRDEVAQGRRAFIVCPLIDPSDSGGMKSVEEETRRLLFGPLKGYRLGMVHGRMPAKEKDEAMAQFASGQLDVLIATTVVELGVDVPEATIIMIEGAERFGLAQLHQLRGRVGRSSYPSRCFLAMSEDGGNLARLRVLERTNDGFEVAEEDLKIRGEGNIIGTQQSGSAIFKTARTDDLALMTAAREAAADLIRKDATLSRHDALRQIVSTLRQTSHRE